MLGQKWWKSQSAEQKFVDPDQVKSTLIEDQSTFNLIRVYNVFNVRFYLTFNVATIVSWKVPFTCFIPP